MGKVNFDDVVALVETDGFISQVYCYNMFKKIYKLKDNENFWQDIESRMVCIKNIQLEGYKEKMPVSIIIDFVRIYDRIVGFYHDTSIIVDHSLIEDFLEKTFKNARYSHIQAQNFHLVLDHIEELNKNAKK